MKTAFVPHSYITRKIVHPSFQTRRMVGRWRPLLPEILGHTHPVSSKTPICKKISLVAPQAWHLVKKVILTLTGSPLTTRFPTSLRWTSYVICKPPPPKGELKTQNGRFPPNSALHLNKICYKVSLCEHCQHIVVRHSLAYLTVQKWLVVDVPFYIKFWPKLTHPFTNANFQSIFARSISAATLSEKRSIKTNEKSTMCFAMILKWTAYVAP